MLDITKWKEQLVGQDGKPLPASTNIVLSKITWLFMLIAFLLGATNGSIITIIFSE